MNSGKRKSYNLKDVAALAGVSLGTASKVINNLYVKPELRIRVEQAMEELHYVPNAIARSLKVKNTKAIGVMIPDISSPIIGKVLRGVEDVGRKAGYSILLYDVALNPTVEEEALRIYIEKKVDGIIYSSNTISDEFARRVAVSGIPVSLILTSYQAKGMSSVVIDNEKAAFEAVDYLCRCGHKKIAMLAGLADDVNAGIPRLEGYKRALEINRIPFSKELVIHGGYHMERGCEDTLNLLKQNPGFTALFAVADEVAVGALKALNSRNIKVPDQVSLMGFDGIDIVNYTTPRLATIEQPFYQIGAEGTKVLIDKIENGRADSRLVLDYKLVKGESVRVFC